MDINIKIMFFRFTIIPSTPRVNKINPTCRKFSNMERENRDSNPGAHEEHFVSNEAR